jgi:O-acetyl-ADP-ribose deacetylase
MHTKLQAVLADITTLDVEAVVTAANTGLLGGGGVYGAIHAAAGPALAEECLRIGECAVGDVRVSSGHRLRAKYILHAVGPRWHGGLHGEWELLSNCYRKCIELVSALGVATIAFPGISTGIRGFPVPIAARVAIDSVGLAVNRAPLLREVLFCCYSMADLRIYRALLAERQNGS